MTDAVARTFLVDKTRLSRWELRQSPIDETAMASGQVLLRVDRFAFTANNVTYAAMGDAMQYWRFFPAPDDLGCIPVWGFAEVQASRCEGVVPGERFYGYYPMSTHLVVQPGKVASHGFVDTVEHRSERGHLRAQLAAAPHLRAGAHGGRGVVPFGQERWQLGVVHVVPTDARPIRMRRTRSSIAKMIPIRTYAMPPV